MDLTLNSEYNNLKAVLMHRPGIEIDRLTPYNIKEYLYEDVPYLDEMQAEHDEFRMLIKEAAGAKIFRLHELLTDVLADKNLLLDAVKTGLKSSGLTEMAEELAYRLSPAECGGALIEGLMVNEIKYKFPSGFFKNHSGRDYLIKPNPNFVFMRDPAAIVHNGVICSRMKFAGRQGEPYALKIIFENHPLFRESFRKIYPKNEDAEDLSIEGGDVIVLSPKSLAIGYTERTDKKAIKRVAAEVLKDDRVERVYQVHLPKLRNCMHLDTVFTIIDENLIVAYPGAMDAELTTIVYHKEGVNNNGEVIVGEEIIRDSFLNVLKNEIKFLEVIETGDGHAHYGPREQYYDGANLFAISPRRVISYNRNTHTNRALKEAGVEVLEIRSSELSRGLGGPRCMTMPLERQKY